jgi:RHS repeat-associated protein
LTEVTWPLRPGSVVPPSVSYTYDAAGNRTQLTTSNQVIDYTFDDLNRLKTVKPVGSGVPIATYVYDGVGNRASVTHDNGVTTTYAYNRRNRLTGIQHKLGATLLLGMAYTLDPSGLRTGITETGQIDRTVSYTYDGVKRLTSESVIQLGNDRRTNWTYDRTGNRLTQTKSLGPVGSPTGTATTAYVYDANDRLETEALTLSGTVPGATSGTTNYTYDNAGNRTRKVSPTETIDSIYDDANRLAELQTLAGDVTRYIYAHDGIRLSQTRDATGANPVTTHYLIDPNTAYAQVIEEAEQHGGGALSVKALYAVGDDRIRRYTPAVAANGSNPGVPAGLRYYHADGLGSTRLLTDETGTVTDRTTYEAFGEIDAAASAQTSDNAFLYTGEQLDPNSGFYYLRARYMDPRVGRFARMDAFAGRLSDPISINKHVYGNSNPVTYVDPSGFVSLHETSISQSIISSLQTATRIGSFAINTYDKVDKLITLLQIGQGAANAFEVMRQFSQQQQGGVSDSGFIDTLKNLDEAGIVLSRNFGWVLKEMAMPKKERQIKEFLANPRNKLLVYGPTPYLRATPWLPPGTRIPVGTVKLSKSTRSIELELGRASGQGGRVVGIGHSYGSAKNQGSQWWRMDWHSPHGAGSNDRIDGDYHFHTQTAP